LIDNTHTHTHTHTQRDTVVAISSTPFHVVGAHNQNNKRLRPLFMGRSGCICRSERAAIEHISIPVRQFTQTGRPFCVPEPSELQTTNYTSHGLRPSAGLSIICARKPNRQGPQNWRI